MKSNMEEEDCESPYIRTAPLSKHSHRLVALNLQKSLQKLDESISSNTGILRSSQKLPGNHASIRKNQSSNHVPAAQFDISSVFEDSVFKTPQNRLFQSRLGSAGLDMTSTPIKSFEDNNGNSLTSDVTIPVNFDENHSQKACSSLYNDFLQVFQNHPSENQIFELITEYERLCLEQCIYLKSITSKGPPTQHKYNRVKQTLDFMKLECITWNLLHTLYEDRLKIESNNDPDAMVIDIVGKKLSDKQLIDNLYERNSQLRQSQKVIDWLEKTIAMDFDDTYYDKAEYFSSQPIAWENSLNRLQHSNNTRQLITEMDPDAPVRQNKPLDDLDKDDEELMLRYLFSHIRAGLLDKAQALCIKMGQPWRAASLEGWRIYHDPNFEAEGLLQEVKQPEGNIFRDIWKTVCWRMTEDERISKYEKALYAALSGNLKALLPVCNTWDDYLWAYFRVMVDKDVENEIHENTMQDRKLEDLPNSYLDEKFTPTLIFQEIQACPNSSIQMQAANPFHIIQKYIILDDIQALIEEMYEIVRNPKKYNSYLFRFMAHLIMFFRTIGHICKEELCIAILEAFVKDLIDNHYISLVSTYTATLPQDRQNYWYAKFLEGISDRMERQQCLQLAEESGLNVPVITKMVVENIRNREVTIPSGTSGIVDVNMELQCETTKEDLKKINAIDWLVFDQSQRAEALKQANALMRIFLVSKKLEAAREVFTKIPPDSLNVISRQWQMQTGSAELPPEDENARREFLCFNAYLTAQDSFNDWFEHYHHSRPERPKLAVAANFTEKVAYEHLMKEYVAAMDRWQHTLKLQTKVTVDRLFNVLLFVSGGWMVDQHTEQVDENRQHQMLRLRELCLPQVTFLLHKVLHSTEQFQKCVQLADTIASEHHGLYKVFRKDELKEFLAKVRESSLALLDQNLDPLGYTIK